MICSICQTEGHNRQTCSVVVRYEYDDCGVKCRINPNDEGDYQPVEPYCLPCGAKTEECDCGKYKCGKWFNEEKGKFQGAPRRSSPRPKKITPKPACFACGQVETECHLEITAEGKTLCCDCLYIENHPDATCHRCDKKLYSKTLVLCGGGGGECETWYCATCHADGTHDCPVCGDEEEFSCGNCGHIFENEEDWSGRCDEHSCHYCECDCSACAEEEDDDETVSVVSEDTCECCGRPYDHRNPHRQSEMCDCVQNDDGTLSRPEVSICEACGVPETDECRPDCAYQARRQREEEEEHRQKSCYSPTRDQLIALGKYKLAKFQIGKSEQKDETNWNEDGDDELCSAIDASGNALY